MQEKKLRLEEHIPGPTLRPLEFQNTKETFRVGSALIHYQEFENLLAPDFAFFYAGENASISIENGLSPLIVKEIKAIDQTQARIENLGVPREQFIIQSGDFAVTVSNYMGVLGKDFKDEIAEWFRTMVVVCRDPFPRFENIFIVPSKGERLHTNEPINGRYKAALLGILLYPGAFQKKEHRIGHVSNLTGTLTHEYFHQFNTRAGATRLSYEWMEIGGWRWHFMHPELIAGNEQFSKYESFIESDYGKQVSVEEFCDAAVKAVYHRESFKDPAKRDFFDKYFIDAGKSLHLPSFQLVLPKKSRIPSFPRKFSFTVMGLKKEPFVSSY